jgi:HTH-type transcriptional regulator/antitoxin HigA
MIKNEKQYRITKKKLLSIHDEAKQIRGAHEHLPAKERLILVSLMTMQDQLETEIATYDLIKTKAASLLEERSIDDLPNLLIEFKIHSGMTQKEFSEKVGMKEQQLQRYEAENFKSISFKNLLKIIHAIGLKITVKGTISGDNQSIA